jgi:hypothetical protein
MNGIDAKEIPEGHRDAVRIAKILVTRFGGVKRETFQELAEPYNLLV